MAYTTIAKLYDYGLPRGLLPNPGREIAAVYPASNTLELDDHGFDTDTALLVRAEAGGDLPAPLAAGTTYYAIRLTDSTFQVAASAGGAAVDLTSAGSRIIVTTPLPLQAAIDWATDLVNQSLPAHAVPIDDPAPLVIEAVTSSLAVERLLAYTGRASSTIAAIIAQARKELERYAKGVPIRGNATPTPANLAVVVKTTGAFEADSEERIP